MKLLAIETATEACSAALFIDDAVTERFVVQPRGHSELVLSMLDELLAEAGLTPQALDALAFSRGPGSFTGVRIATGVIQGVAFATDLPVVPISTLAAMAQRCYRERGQRRILPALDARMSEVYWGAYELDSDGIVQSTIDDAVSSPQQVSLPSAAQWYGVGSGWGSYGDDLRCRLGGGLGGIDADLQPSAYDVALLGVKGVEAGRSVSAELALPVYLRDKVAWAKKQ